MACNVVDGFRVVFPALPNSDYLPAIGLESLSPSCSWDAHICNSVLGSGNQRHFMSIHLRHWPNQASLSYLTGNQLTLPLTSWPEGAGLSPRCLGGRPQPRGV